MVSGRGQLEVAPSIRGGLPKYAKVTEVAWNGQNGEAQNARVSEAEFFSIAPTSDKPQQQEHKPGLKPHKIDSAINKLTGDELKDTTSTIRADSSSLSVLSALPVPGSRHQSLSSPSVSALEAAPPISRVFATAFQGDQHLHAAQELQTADSVLNSMSTSTDLARSSITSLGRLDAELVNVLKLGNFSRFGYGGEFDIAAIISNHWQHQDAHVQSGLERSEEFGSSDTTLKPSLTRKAAEVSRAVDIDQPPAPPSGISALVDKEWDVNGGAKLRTVSRTPLLQDHGSRATLSRSSSSKSSCSWLKQVLQHNIPRRPSQLTMLTARPPHGVRPLGHFSSEVDGPADQNAESISDPIANHNNQSNYQRRLSESLSKAILNLETLLSEALLVVEDAADTKDVTSLDHILKEADEARGHSTSQVLLPNGQDSTGGKSNLSVSESVISTTPVIRPFRIQTPRRKSSLAALQQPLPKRSRKDLQTKMPHSGLSLTNQHHALVEVLASEFQLDTSSSGTESSLDESLANMKKDYSFPTESPPTAVELPKVGFEDVAEPSPAKRSLIPSYEPSISSNTPTPLRFHKDVRQADQQSAPAPPIPQQIQHIIDARTEQSQTKRRSVITRPAIRVLKDHVISVPKHSVFLEDLDRPPSRNKVGESTSAVVPTSGHGTSTQSVPAHDNDMRSKEWSEVPEKAEEQSAIHLQGVAGAQSSGTPYEQGSKLGRTRVSLRDRRHISFRGTRGLSFRRLHRRQPIARDWSAPRKRFVASIACVNTAFIGLIVGIYVSLPPRSQSHC